MSLEHRPRRTGLCPTRSALHSQRAARPGLSTHALRLTETQRCGQRHGQSTVGSTRLPRGLAGPDSAGGRAQERPEGCSGKGLNLDIVWVTPVGEGTLVILPQAHVPPLLRMHHTIPSASPHPTALTDTEHRPSHLYPSFWCVLTPKTLCAPAGEKTCHLLRSASRGFSGNDRGHASRAEPEDLDARRPG